jgi:hypothetical protein
MDEKALRDHFERAARANLPPSTVDVERARKVGRRRLKIRRAGVPATSFAVVMAVGVGLFAGGVLPTEGSGRPSVNKTQAKPARGPVAPASFDPLAIYATFGWLPPGFTVTNPNYPQSATQARAQAEGRSLIALTVYAAHQCSVTGQIWSPPKGTFQFTDGGRHRRYLHSRRYAHGLLCDDGPAQSNPNPLIPAGHLAGGHPAYLMLEDRAQPTALAWQYARKGWAVAQWQGPRPAQIRKIAEHVRYGSNLRLRFPFRLKGIPASWKVEGAGSQVEGGKLRGYLLYLNPGGDSHGVTILIEPPYTGSCVNIGGMTEPVTFDGATGVNRAADHNACFASLHGMYVDVSSDQAGGALGLLHHLQVLGPDPANWTTNPLG